MLASNDITWAFGYSGKYIAEALLREGSTIIKCACGWPYQVDRMGGETCCHPWPAVHQ